MQTLAPEAIDYHLKLHALAPQAIECHVKMQTLAPDAIECSLKLHALAPKAIESLVKMHAFGASQKSAKTHVIYTRKNAYILRLGAPTHVNMHTF
jgi:hypothetical protein